MRTKVKVHGYFRLPHQLKVLARDNYQCTSCSNPEGILVYKKQNISDKDRMLSLDDFVTLCRRCKQNSIYSLSDTYARNKEIIKLYSLYKIDELAKRFSITSQRIHQILDRAEKRGEANFRDIVKERMKTAPRNTPNFIKHRNFAIASL